MSKKTYTIGQIAKISGVSVETIRYYQRRHLLAIPAKDFGSIRDYPIEFIEQLAFIKKAKSLGFSLDEVASILMLYSKRKQFSANNLIDLSAEYAGLINPSVCLIAQERLAQVCAKIDELKNIELALKQLVTQCESNQFESNQCTRLGAVTKR